MAFAVVVVVAIVAVGSNPWGSFVGSHFAAFQSCAFVGGLHALKGLRPFHPADSSQDMMPQQLEQSSSFAVDTVAAAVAVAAAGVAVEDTAASALADW